MSASATQGGHNKDYQKHGVVTLAMLCSPVSGCRQCFPMLRVVAENETKRKRNICGALKADG